MTVYKIINPSDPYHLTADDLVLAAIAACLLGHGKYALEATDGSEGVPLFVFGGHDEWFAAQGAGSFDEALTAATGQRAEALAKVLESVTIVGTRSSLNDIGEAAARLAAGVRKMVAQAHERTPYDAMGPVDAPNPPAARAPLADVQPGGRVRLGDQAERARFESWATAQGFDPSVRLMLTSHPPQDGGYADNWLQRLWQEWQAALSAQPSPGGQGDSRSEKAETFLRQYLTYLRSSPRQGLRPRWCDVYEALEVAIEALAARQPVGEPVRVSGDMVDGELSVASAIDQVVELFPSADRAALRTLAACFTHHSIYRYAATPAQAVDLGQLPRAVELLSNVSRTLVDWAADEQREAIGIVKALIDSHSAGGQP